MDFIKEINKLKVKFNLQSSKIENIKKNIVDIEDKIDHLETVEFFQCSKDILCIEDRLSFFEERKENKEDEKHKLYAYLNDEVISLRKVVFNFYRPRLIHTYIKNDIDMALEYYMSTPSEIMRHKKIYEYIIELCEGAKFHRQNKGKHL